MGARSEIHVVDQPFPVVFQAFVSTLPTRGFELTGVDADRGWITMQTRNTRLTVAVGAIDAITTEWVAIAELKIGVFRERHERQFATIADALDTYLRAYYPHVNA